MKRSRLEQLTLHHISPKYVNLPSKRAVPQLMKGSTGRLPDIIFGLVKPFEFGFFWVFDAKDGPLIAV